MRRSLLLLCTLLPAALAAQTSAKARPDSTAAHTLALKDVAILPISMGLVVPLVSVAPSGAVSITLSAYQRRQLAEFQRTSRELAERQQLFISAIVGGVKDPGTIADWTMEMKNDSTITLTPPAPKDSLTKAKKP